MLILLFSLSNLKQFVAVYLYISLWLIDTQVWRALLQHMPLAEMMGSLSRMTSLGLLDAAGKNSQAPLVIDRLKNDTLIKDSRYSARHSPVGLVS